LISTSAVDKTGTKDSQLHAADAPAGTHPPLAVHEVVKRFGELTVLDGVELELEPGEAVLVAGRNGAGKTTLLRIAAGLIAPDQGVVSAFGLSPERRARDYRRRVGLLSAGDRGLYARLTVRQNLEFNAALALIPNARRAAAIDRALARFSLEPLSPRRVDRISLGQRQRVRLALAFLTDPGLVLLDEPSTSLDEAGIAGLREALADVTARGGAALWCAPTGTPPALPADRAYVLEQGVLRVR
jgi:ABC-2 type transport system ATP-binding protein